MKEVDEARRSGFVEQDRNASVGIILPRSFFFGFLIFSLFPPQVSHKFTEFMDRLQRKERLVTMMSNIKSERKLEG